MSRHEYQIWIGNKLLGVVTDIYTDMPIVSGIFHPSEAFADYKPLFEEERRLKSPGNDAEWLRLMDQLAEQGLQIEKPNGIHLQFCRPGANISPGFAFLHLDTTSARWRPT
jgi:hypothetical protein